MKKKKIKQKQKEKEESRKKKNPKKHLLNSQIFFAAVSVFKPVLYPSRVPGESQLVLTDGRTMLKSRKNMVSWASKSTPSVRQYKLALAWEPGGLEYWVRYRDSCKEKFENFVKGAFLDFLSFYFLPLFFVFFLLFFFFFLFHLLRSWKFFQWPLSVPIFRSN